MARALRLLVTTALALVLAACGGSSSTPDELTGTEVTFQPTNTVLTSADGADYALTADTDKPLTLIFFGYTNCPDICGQVMATLAGTMKRLSEADRDRVEVVFITTDPARDTEEVVGHYVSRYDPEFTGLTGDLDDIIELGLSVGVGIEQGEKLPSGGYDITHGTQVLALGEQDEVTMYWSESVSQAQLANDVHVLLNEG